MDVVKGIEALGGVEQEPNIYLVDGELLVDAGTGLFFSDMKKSIESRYDYYKIKNIVLTHCHFDHSGAARKFRDWLKAEVSAHADEKKSLETGINTMSEMFGQAPKIVTVGRVLRNSSKIKTANFSFDVIHTPGHTPGSICLYEPAKKILISGDTLFEGSVGRFDLPSGSKEQLVGSLEKLLGYDIRYLLPGHGPPKVGGISFLIKQMLAHLGNKRFINYEFY